MKIYITREIPSIAKNLLENAGYEVKVSAKEDLLTTDELHSEILQSQPDAVISLLTDIIDAKFFDLVPNIKIVANYAVGYNNIDIVEAKKRNIIVTNTPDVLTEAVAEHTIALMLAIARRIGESERYIRAGKYTGWGPMLLLGSELKGKKLGLLGAGRIGGRVAEIATRGFGMNVCYYDVTRNETVEKNTGAVFFDTPEMVLQDADFVSIHVPLLDTTRHLIDSNRLALMKKTAYLVNTARGPIIDEDAFVVALKNNVIRGAALDVFEHEPMLAKGLVDLENVVLAPHTGSASDTARTAMAEVAAKNILAVLSGKAPLTQVQ